MGYDILMDNIDGEIYWYWVCDNGHMGALCATESQAEADVVSHMRSCR